VVHEQATHEQAQLPSTRNGASYVGTHAREEIQSTRGQSASATCDGDDDADDETRH